MLTEEPSIKNYLCNPCGKKVRVLRTLNIFLTIHEIIMGKVYTQEGDDKEYLGSLKVVRARPVLSIGQVKNKVV